MNKHVSKAFGIFFLILELAVVPEALRLMLDQRLSKMSPLEIIVLTLTFGSIALCILMSFSSLSEHGSYPAHTFLFELMVFICCIAPVTDLATKVLDSAGKPAWNLAVNTVFYLDGISLAYVILRYEFLIIEAGRKRILKRAQQAASLLTILDVLAVFLNIRYGFFFTITESGAYHSASTFWTSYIAPSIILIIMFVTAAREIRPGRQRQTFLFFWLFTLLTTLIQNWQKTLSLQYAGYTLSVIVIYMNIQSELDIPCAKT